MLAAKPSSVVPHWFGECRTVVEGLRAASPPRAGPVAIGIAGFAAGLRQHAMHLAAMMRLVVEHMRDQKPCRLVHFPLDRARVIGELACERCGVEPVRPVDHDRIERLALALELVPVAMERHGFGNAAVGTWRAGKAAHPDAIGPE